MAATAKFVSGDGVPHEVSTDSLAFEVMSKDGSFTRLDSDEESVTAVESKPAVVLTKLNKTQLVAEGEKRGLTLVAEEMTKAQMIAAIDAAPTV